MSTNNAPLEESIVKRILKKLRALPTCKAEKTKGGPHKKGTPDIMGCYQGRAFAIEVKRTIRDHPTALQQVELDAWKEAGAISGVARSWEDVVELFKQHGINLEGE